MREILSVISALNLMLLPIAPASEAARTQNNISVEPTYEVAIDTQNYLQGVLYKLPQETAQGEEASPDVGMLLRDTLATAAESLAPPPPPPPPAPVAAAPAPVVMPEPKKTLLGTYRLTAYCPCKKCCGKSPSNPGYGITASGARATEGITVAMANLPFGTRIYIDGVGERVVQDRGVKGKVIDIFVSTHEACFNALYNRSAQVWILE